MNVSSILYITRSIQALKTTDSVLLSSSSENNIVNVTRMKHKHRNMKLELPNKEYLIPVDAQLMNYY